MPAFAPVESPPDVNDLLAADEDDGLGEAADCPTKGVQVLVQLAAQSLDDEEIAESWS
jgi:hypothetical protein